MQVRLTGSHVHLEADFQGKDFERREKALQVCGGVREEADVVRKREEGQTHLFKVVSARGCRRIEQHAAFLRELAEHGVQHEVKQEWGESVPP